MRILALRHCFKVSLPLDSRESLEIITLAFYLAFCLPFIFFQIPAACAVDTPEQLAFRLSQGRRGQKQLLDCLLAFWFTVC